MRNAETVLVVTEQGSTPNSVWRTLESRMMRKYPVRFGGRLVEKGHHDTSPSAYLIPFSLGGTA